MCRFVCFPILIICVLSVPVNRALADPDPIALLSGLENARQNLHGKLSVTMVSEGVRPNQRDRRTVSLEILFDGERRRFIQEETVLVLNDEKPGERPTPSERYKAIGRDVQRAVALGIGRLQPTRVRTVYDGAQVIEYSEQAGSAAIRAPEKGATTLCFDPRVFGLTRVLTVNRTLDAALGFRTAKEVRILGREEIRGHPVWHVVEVRPVGQVEYHFWLEDREGYRVHRFEYRSNPTPPGKPTHDRIELHYDTGGKYPAKVEEENSNPAKEYRVTWTIEKSDLDHRPNPLLFGLAGLEMPPGEMVIDERISQVAGYWDGEGVAQDRSAAVKRVASTSLAEHRGRDWGLTTLVGVALLALIFVASKYFRRAGAQSAP